MTKEQIKAKAKERFPNDEFKQQIVIDAINWATKELEKENAELKEQCSILADCNTCISACKTENIEMKNNLTKAKELLERLLITSCNSDVLNLLPNCSEVLRVRVEAEQFLKDLEK